jgi:hypothetical protein
MTPQELYLSIAAEYEKNNDVILGKMMSSPGIKVNDKVFAFYHKDEMGFRLGKKFEPEAHGVHKYYLLNPFKTKPPLKAWFILPKEEMEKWSEFAELAYKFTQNI